MDKVELYSLTTSKLTVKIKQSNCMLTFCPHQNKIQYHPQITTSNNEIDKGEIQSIKLIKYLGVPIDENYHLIMVTFCQRKKFRFRQVLRRQVSTVFLRIIGL